MLFRGISSSICPKFTEIYSFLLVPQAFPVFLEKIPWCYFFAVTQNVLWKHLRPLIKPFEVSQRKVKLIKPFEVSQRKVKLIKPFEVSQRKVKLKR